MAIVNGTINETTLLEGKRSKDFTKGISVRYQDESPILSVQMKVAKAQKAKNPEIENYFRDVVPDRDVTTAATAGTATTKTLHVANDTYFNVNDVIKLPEATITAPATQTNSAVVTGVNRAAHTIDIASFSYTTAATPALKVLTAVGDGDEVFVVSNSQGGSSTLGTAKSNSGEINKNYMQYIKSVVDIDLWSIGSDNETDVREYKERVQEAHFDIRRAIDKTLIFGEKGKRVGTEGTQYFTNGYKQQVFEQAPENIGNLPTSFTERQLDEYFIAGPAASGVGGDIRFLWAGQNVYLRVNELMKAKQQINAPATIQRAGLNFQEYVLPTGKRILMYLHPAFAGADADSALILDPKEAVIRNFQEMGVLSLYEGLEKGENRVGKIAEWRSIVAGQLKSAKASGWINLT